MNAELPAALGGAPAVRRDSHRLWPILGEEDRRSVLDVLERNILSGSYAPAARAFEARFAEFVGARFALLTHCGTSALQLALAAAGVREGDEVIVPAYSFVATPLSVVLQGATPVFVDVDRQSGHLELAAVEAARTERTRAVMPVHIHGAAADMDAILALARRLGLAVVEDAAQAHGALANGRPVGALGAAGAFSLQSSKNLSAGEGGVFVTNDRDAAERANRVRNFGQDLHLDEAAGFDAARPLDGNRALDSGMLGSMFRGNEMMAALASSQLSRLPALTERAQANAARLSSRLRELPGVEPPQSAAGRTSVHHKYRVALDPQKAGLACTPRELRDAMIAALRAEGLEVVLWQTEPLPAQAIFRERTLRALAPQPGGTNLAENYDPKRYPRTQALLDGSLLLFSQSCPLIAQDAPLVDRYAEAFARVWRHREAIVKAHRRA
ncbi:MAG TPA: DegT/DnrJ/EryC1/StrS family aminotransferase [Polyangiaceae bacterium]|nr:DegT/DnrJ/EryC1/StrS family aminotransferase [Polyangiaceae bacterium]